LCQFAHTKEEQLYHPDFYKTVPCHSSKCQKYCPFCKLLPSVPLLNLKTRHLEMVLNRTRMKRSCRLLVNLSQTLITIMLINIAKLGVHVAESPADDILQSLWKDIENYRNNFSLEELKRIHYSSALEKALISLKISDRGN